MKKMFVFILMLSLLLSVSTFGIEPSALSVGWVSDSPEGADNIWNQMAESGLEQAAEDFNFIVNKYYSNGPEDYIGNLTEAADDNDLIITVGFLFESAITDVAPLYPSKKFVAIDFFPQIANVQSYTFKEHEGSFLVGIIAGLNTKTNTIGFVGGMDFDLINKFECGFTAGVKTVKSSTEVLVGYAGAFDDLFAGYYYSSKQHEIGGADVIYHAAGGTGNGVIEAAETFDFWAIGVDVDQSNLAPDNVLCSMVKKVDVAVYKAVESLVNDTFNGGTLIPLGLAENGVDYSDLAGNLNKKSIKDVEYYKAEIIGGNIIVPSTYGELDAYLSE